MEQALAFYDNMKNLEAQGAPIFWQKVADQMAMALRAATQVPQPPPKESEG